MRLEALSDEEFFSRDGLGTHLFFRTDDLDRATHFIMLAPGYGRVSRIRPRQGIELDASALSRLTGYYVSENPAKRGFQSLKVSLEEDGLTLYRPNVTDILLAESETQFFTTRSSNAFRFELDPNGDPQNRGPDPGPPLRDGRVHHRTSLGPPSGPGPWSPVAQLRREKDEPP